MQAPLLRPTKHPYMLSHLHDGEGLSFQTDSLVGEPHMLMHETHEMLPSAEWTEAVHEAMQSSMSSFILQYENGHVRSFFLRALSSFFQFKMVHLPFHFRFLVDITY